MDILSFEKKHVKEATEIALANYYDERQYVKELPQVCDIPDLYSFAENGLGVAAFENEKMIGFLCCCEPFDNAFRATDVRGIFSPMGANASVPENRPKIYASMYQTAAAKWVKAGAVSESVEFCHSYAEKRRIYQAWSEF